MYVEYPHKSFWSTIIYARFSVRQASEIVKTPPTSLFFIYSYPFLQETVLLLHFAIKTITNNYDRVQDYLKFSG